MTPGPVTVTVRHGSVVVAERTYKSAQTAELALWGSPKWLLKPVRTMLRGRTPKMVAPNTQVMNDVRGATG